jgi:hypothetical protein
MSTNRFFTWIASVSLFGLLAALLTKGTLWLIYGGYHYRSNLTVLIAACCACLLAALVMLYAPPLLPRLIPRTPLSKVIVAANIAIVLLLLALVFWQRHSVPNLVQEYEQSR